MQLLSSPFSRRYTPPTCTLEVTGLTSALSKWAGRPLLKNLQFQLSLEDLRQEGGQPIQLRGDRSQLDALTETVETYVQDFLNQPSTGLNPRLNPQTEAALPEAEPSTAGTASGKQTIEKAMFLQPQSLLSHTFVPGSLIAETSAAPISLSVTQLFDLATALEEYSAEAVSLPVSHSPASRLAGIPLWARAAAVVVAAAGLSIAALELFSPSSTQLASQKSPNPRQSSLQSSPGKLLVPSPPASTNPTSPPGFGSPTPLPLTSPPAIPAPAPLANDAPASPGAQPQNPSAPTAPKQQVAIQPRTAAQSNSAVKPPPLPPESDVATIAAAENSPTASASAPATEQLADTIPQVAEARSYFAQRWQPPAGLKQTLEYTLVLNANGTLQRAVPLGQAASTYLDRTPIPLANQPFVSAPEGKGSAFIRLVLRPNGKVETFLQPGN